MSEVMSKRAEVKYWGKSYPLRLCKDPKREYEGDIAIGSESLENDLMHDGAFFDEKAQAIDEGIYFYAPDDVFNSLDDEEFQKWIDENVD